MNNSVDKRAVHTKVVTQEFFEVLLRADGVVWLVRRPCPYNSVGDLHKAYDNFLAVIDDWLLERRITSGLLGTRHRTNMAWLYDLRSVRTGRNDDALEKAIQSRQPELLQRSPIFAVLVMTAAGRAQMHRLRKAKAQGEPEIFDDPEAAVAWLLERLEKR